MGSGDRLVPHPHFDRMAGLVATSCGWQQGADVVLQKVIALALLRGVRGVRASVRARTRFSVASCRASVRNSLTFGRNASWSTISKVPMNTRLLVRRFITTARLQRLQGNLLLVDGLRAGQVSRVRRRLHTASSSGVSGCAASPNRWLPLL